MADISTYKSPNKARNIAILRAYLSGMSMKEIGLKYPGSGSCLWDAGRKIVRTNEHMTPTTVRVVINKILCHLYDKPNKEVNPEYTYRTVYRLAFPFTAKDIRAMKEDILIRLGNTCPHCGESLFNE